MIASSERQGKFTASRISDLLAEGTGKSRENYILDVALEEIGILKDIDTAAMKHGRNSQMDAFEKVVKPLFKDAEWCDEYIPINEMCGASPDIIGVGGVIPLDIKCPYTQGAFIDQTRKSVKRYIDQMQTQMLALGGDTSFLCYYLTRPVEWKHNSGQVEWREYPMPLEDRHEFIEVQQDVERQEAILNAVASAWPKKERLLELLHEAKIVDEVEFFYWQKLKGHKYNAIKDASNRYKNSYIRVEDEFYYRINL